MTAIYPDLAGKVVVITGGANGIGEAVVEMLAVQKSRVAIIDMAVARGEAIASRLARTGVAVKFLQADLRDIDASRAAVDEARAALGPVDVLINNAGNGERHNFDSVTPAYWDDRIAVNLRHMMFMAQAVAPDMRARKRGSIVNLSSTSWLQGAINLIAYTSAKAAVIGFTRSLARELGGDGIRANCVSPGWVMTEHERSGATPERLARTQERQALKGEIMPRDLAAMIVFLASDEARMCSGQNFIVDAGSV